MTPSKLEDIEHAIEKAAAVDLVEVLRLRPEIISPRSTIPGCASPLRLRAVSLPERDSEVSDKGVRPKPIGCRLRKPIQLPNRPWQFPQG